VYDTFATSGVVRQTPSLTYTASLTIRHTAHGPLLSIFRNRLIISCLYIQCHGAKGSSSGCGAVLTILEQAGRQIGIANQVLTGYFTPLGVSSG